MSTTLRTVNASNCQLIRRPLLRLSGDVTESGRTAYIVLQATASVPYQPREPPQCRLRGSVTEAFSDNSRASD